MGMRLQREEKVRIDESTFHYVHIEVEVNNAWKKTGFGISCKEITLNSTIEARAVSMLIGSEDFVVEDLTPITWLPTI